MNSPTARFWRNGFWQRWVIANALGELVGLGTVAAAGFFLFQRLGEPANVPQALVFAGAFVVLGAFEGVVIGLAQRQVLRTLLPSVRGWVLATVVGAMVAWAVGMVPSTVASLLQTDAAASPAPSEPPLVLILLLAAGLGAIAGPLLAAFQWRSLRRVVPERAWLWLPANAAAWALGMPVIFLGTQANEFTSSATAIAALTASAIFTAGALVGAVHGLVLLRLARGG
jgi:glucan phosphoethanolaminetransferase (alkaline phosphatase superfamily)